MLTDIFAYRYQDQPIWPHYTEVEQRLLNQALGIIRDALLSGGANDLKWQRVHDQLAREFGVDELSKRSYGYWTENAYGKHWVSGHYPWERVCDQFVKEAFTGQCEADRFIKERVSFIELAMRLRGEEVVEANSQIPKALVSAALRDKQPRLSGMRVPGSAVEGVKAHYERINSVFKGQVAELNERFRRAKAPLTYHNGFIQFAMDQQTEKQIAKPFWDLIADPIWKNVDIDMKEALDVRDSNGKDPAFFAAKALESAIKIVSDRNGWTHGKERGAANYIDNLVSKENGRYLARWEGEMLKDYFSKVRNSVGHGPGAEPMPELTLLQTDWAIETAMSWVRTLVRRM